MSAAGEWDTHPCALEEMGGGFPWGFLCGSNIQLGRGDSGRGNQGMLRGRCPPPASGVEGAGRAVQPGVGGREPSLPWARRSPRV